MRQSTAIAATLLAIAPWVLAAGTAHVVNKCGSQVYFAVIGQSAHADMVALPANGYSEAFTKNNVGISIKLSPSVAGAVTQFEYTWVAGNSVAYDISNIDGNPFSAGGMSLVPSMEGAEGFPSCVTVDCPAGQDRCDAAYNLPDDVRTMVCPENSDLTFTLCPGGAPAGGQTSARSADSEAGAEAGSEAGSAQTSSKASSPAQQSPAAQDDASNAVQASSPTAGNEAPASAQGSPTGKAAAATGGRGKHQQRRAHAAQRL